MFFGNRESWTWKSLVPILSLFFFLALPSANTTDSNAVAFAETQPATPECDIEINKTCCIPPTTLGSSPCEGKVTRILLEFTGDTCTATTNPQSGKAKCEGDVTMFPADVVIAAKDADKYMAYPSTGLVVGDRFEILPVPGKSKLKANTKFNIGGQALKIHTSCSKPLSAGDQFGSVKVIEFESEKGGLATIPPPPDPNQTMCVGPNSPAGTPCTGKLVEVVFEYTGKGCAGPLGNPQGDKATCSGDPAMANLVKIAYVGKDADKISVTPDDMTVKIGNEVRLTATGRDRLHADSKFEISAGGVLQELKIHTSCSQTIALGDEFGSLKVTGFTDENGVVTVLGDSTLGPDFRTQCELPTAPGLVEYQYNVTNPTEKTLFVTIMDDQLGAIVEDYSLAGGGTSHTFYATATLDKDTENTATVTAGFADIGGTEECIFEGDLGWTCPCCPDQACYADYDVEKWLCSCPGMKMCAEDVSNTVLVTVPPPPPFTCTKPISELTMIWDGDVTVDIKAWAGSVGTGIPQMISGIARGDMVTVAVPAGAPNDIYWEIFDAGMTSKIGESKFHISCSDEDMNGPEDCGKNLGDGKSKKVKSKKCKSKKGWSDPTLVNDWLFMGAVDADSTLVCPMP